MLVNEPSVQELIDSVSDGFDKLIENKESIEALYVKLRLLDDMLWNTIVSKGLG